MGISKIISDKSCLIEMHILCCISFYRKDDVKKI